MLKETFKSIYATVWFNNVIGLQLVSYNSESDSMTDSDWKNLMIRIAEITDFYKPKYIIDDNTNRLYSYPPDMQEWTLNLYIEMWNRNGLKKYVQILPSNIVGQLTTEQIIEMGNTLFSPHFETKYVETMEQALDWIGIGSDYLKS